MDTWLMRPSNNEINPPAVKHWDGDQMLF